MGRKDSIKLIQNMGFECLSITDLGKLKKYLKSGDILGIISDRNKYIVPKEILDKVSSFSINMHPSLLPNHLGSFSLFWSLVFGDDFGVTAHHMTPLLDDGPIAYQQKIEYLPSHTFREVYCSMKKIVLEITGKLLLDLKSGKTFNSYPQALYMQRKKHTISSSMPLINMMSKSWDTKIVDARKIMAGHFDISGRVITEIL